MAHAPESKGKMSHQPLRVFIADDSAPIVEVLTELVTSPGRVEVVGTGGTEQAAIDAIRALKPDVVVLDLQLANGSGTNVIKAVRGAGELSAVRLLVTSNHTSPQLRAGCLELGADGYFDKVKELKQLTACLARLAEEKMGAPQ